jgi:hypothetical protein
MRQRAWCGHGGLSEPIVALQSLSCKHPTARREHTAPQNHMLCPLSISPIYIPLPCIPVKPSCKAQWQFFCCCCGLLFSLFPSRLMTFKLLQHPMHKYCFFIELSVLFLISFDQTICSHLCVLYLCCFAGSHCVLGPQQWPRSFSNYRFPPATSVDSLYRVIVSLFSCCTRCTNLRNYQNTCGVYSKFDLI